MEGRDSSESGDDSSDDDDRQWVEEVRKERMKIRREKAMRDNEGDLSVQPKFYEIKPGEEFKMADIGSRQSKEKSK